MQPPNTESLHHHAQHQADCSIEQIGCNSDAVEHKDDEDNGLIMKKCAAHNFKGWKPPTTVNISYYPPGWRVVLSHAKDEFLYHIATTHPFPECSSHLHEVEDILNKNIESYEEGNGVLEDGLNSYFILMNHCL
jgi:hypothetical protein